MDTFWDFTLLVKVRLPRAYFGATALMPSGMCGLTRAAPLHLCNIKLVNKQTENARGNDGATACDQHVGMGVP